MHLRAVEIFCDVARLRSFSKAAAQHSVTQPSATQSVHQLEQRLGTKLVDRSQRPLELTPAGHIFFEGCNELLERFRSLEDEVRQLQDRVVGKVRVAAIFSVGLMPMKAFVQKFSERFPEAKAEVLYHHPDQVYDAVRHDAADIGIVSFPKPGHEFSCINWQHQPMQLVVSPRHRLATANEVTLSELSGESYIAFTPELPIRRAVDRWLGHAKIDVTIAQQFDDIEKIKRSVEVDTGVSLLPAPTVEREVANGSLLAIPVVGETLSRPLGIVHRKHKSLPIAVRKFIDLLREQAGAGGADTSHPAGQNGHDASTAVNGSRVHAVHAPIPEGNGALDSASRGRGKRNGEVPHVATSNGAARPARAKPRKAAAPSGASRLPAAAAPRRTRRS